MNRSIRRALALGALALPATAGCSGQYDDVGTVDLSASRAKAGARPGDATSPRARSSSRTATPPPAAADR